jgi:uncharacterized protein
MARMAWRGLLIGVAAGIFGGVAGLGGGVVMVPLLGAWLGLSQHRAHGTSLVAVVLTGSVGVIPYALGGAVALRLALALALASMVGSSLAAGLSPRVPARALRRVFGILVIVTGLSLPFDALVPAHALATGWALPLGLGTGLLAGAVSGLLGVGGGSVMVPLLVLLFGFGQHLAQGTSLAVMVPAALAGSLQHLRHGHVDVRVAPVLALGVAGGAYMGGRMALALPNDTLRWVFAVLLVTTGVRYALTSRAAR